MSGHYWQRPRPLGGMPRFTGPTVAAALAAGAVTLAGCGGGPGSVGPGSAGASSSGSASGTSPATGSASGTSSAGIAAAAVPNSAGLGSYSPAQLRTALLGTVNGARPASVPQSGEYGTLPDVQTGKQSTRGVTVKPAKCAQATVTGFNSARFAKSPASVVTFRVGRDGVSEVIVAASPATAAEALAAKLPSGCAHYNATVGGRTFTYSIKETPLRGIGDQARALNVKAVGYASVNVWSVVFRSRGFIGAVTIVGPDSSEQGAKVLAEDAYAKATESLH
jgi:hypothetical protein